MKNCIILCILSKISCGVFIRFKKGKYHLIPGNAGKPFLHMQFKRYVAELAIRSVRKMMRDDLLPNRALNFAYRPARFWLENFRVNLKKNKADSGTFYRRLIKTSYEERS